MARRLRFCNPGRFNRKVTVLVRSITRGSTGQEKETWAPMAVIWAERHDVRAQERFRAEQEIASTTAVFETRYRADITPSDHRLECEGRTYDIEGIAELGLRERIEITATAVRV